MSSGRFVSVFLGSVVLFVGSGAGAEVNRWSPGPGPAGGAAHALAAAPSNPAVVYAATEAGVSRSLDGGRTWQRRDGILATDEHLFSGVAALAVDPANPGIVYAAGIFSLSKSVDGGASWRRLNVDAEDPRALALVPGDPATGFVCGREFRIDDPVDFFGGCSRFTAAESTRVLEGIEVESVVVTSARPPAVFASGAKLVPGGSPFFPDSRPVTLRSLDLGESWVEVLDLGGPLAVDPRTPRTVWLGADDGIWRSEDRGESWTRFPLGADASVRDLEVDREPGGRMHAATSLGLLRSNDRGESWELLQPLVGRPLEAVAQSSAGYLVSAPRQGVLRLDGTEVTATTGLTSWTVESLVFEAGTSLRYAAIGPPQGPGAGVYRSAAADAHWEQVFDLATTSVAAAGGAVYTVTGLEGTLYRSPDRGESWLATDRTAIDEVEVLDDAAGTVLAAGFGFDVWRSTDRGESWTAAAGTGTAARGTLQTGGRRLVPDPASPAVVYFVASGREGEIFRSADSGATFSPLPSVPRFWVFTLAPDPHSPGRLYAATANGVHVSENGGGSWRRLSGTGLCEVREVRVDPHRAGRLLLLRDPCGGEAILLSEDSGATWRPLTAGLPALRNSTSTNLTSVAFDPTTPGRLLAGGHGVGTFALEVDASQGGCTPGETVLCLEDEPGDGRFRVTLDFATRLGGGQAGSARTLPLEAQPVRRGGLFYFSGRDNPEVLVKVLNGCALGGHRWVFASAATSVGFTLLVEDTATGEVRVYRNPDVHPALPITDTSAFDGCPPGS